MKASKHLKTLGKRKKKTNPQVAHSQMFHQVNHINSEILGKKVVKITHFPPPLEGGIRLTDFVFSFNMQVAQLVSPVKPAIVEV